MGVHDSLDIRAHAQDFGMNEHLVVARHGAADLSAFEIDRDDPVGRHLVEANGRGLHQETLRIVREVHRYMAGHEVALILAREHTPGIGQLSSQRFGHSCPPGSCNPHSGAGAPLVRSRLHAAAIK
jgi:hypothetical protein